MSNGDDAPGKVSDIWKLSSNPLDRGESAKTGGGDAVYWELGTPWQGLGNVGMRNKDPALLWLLPRSAEVGRVTVVRDIVGVTTGS